MVTLLECPSRLNVIKLSRCLIFLAHSFLVFSSVNSHCCAPAASLRESYWFLCIHASVLYLWTLKCLAFQNGEHFGFIGFICCRVPAKVTNFPSSYSIHTSCAIPSQCRLECCSLFCYQFSQWSGLWFSKSAYNTVVHMHCQMQQSISFNDTIVDYRIPWFMIINYISGIGILRRLWLNQVGPAWEWNRLVWLEGPEFFIFFWVEGRDWVPQ